MTSARRVLRTDDEIMGFLEDSDSDFEDDSPSDYSNDENCKYLLQLQYYFFVWNVFSGCCSLKIQQKRNYSC